MSAKTFYQQYIYPKYYKEELTKICNYCAQNHIKLVFFIPPTHTDLQNRIKDFGLEKEAIQFKKDLEALGKVHDFDYPSHLTQQKSNFLDPFHFNDEISKIISDSIFTKK